jgi:hypothetical protein
MTVDELVKTINSQPQSIAFSEVIETIDANYRYTPTAFKNGSAYNEAGTNEGSCKIFAFAQHHSLNKAQTLACFGNYYHEEVLLNPDGDDHANIRNFMKHGWEGIEFNGDALSIPQTDG